jgi:hypothetical protein
VVAGLAVSGLAAAGVVAATTEPEVSFCTADALIGPNGESYGRRHPDCQFVDDDGELVTTFADGQPLCYVVAPADSSASGGPVVDCDDPGPGLEVRRPG